MTEPKNKRKLRPEDREKVRPMAERVMKGDPNDVRTILSLVVALQAATHSIMERLRPMLDDQSEELTDEEREAVLSTIVQRLDGAADFGVLGESTRAVLPHLMMIDKALA